MALKATRANIRAGPHSRALIIPSQLKIGSRSSIVADRLLLADVRGEISPEDLLDFFENYIEPQFWVWHQKRVDAKNQGSREGKNGSG